MAEDKVEPRETNWRGLLPWTALFQGFRVALDPKKLLLAAAGILCMSFGWWLLAIIFASMFEKPTPERYPLTNYGKQEDSEERKASLAWDDFRRDRRKWNLHHEAVGSPDSTETRELADVAESKAEHDAIEKELKTLREDPDKARYKTLAEIEAALADKRLESDALAKAHIVFLQERVRKPAGRMRTLPWAEDRGPNPYLLVTGQAGSQWERGHFFDWLLTQQFPVLAEPLVKLFLPVKYFFHPDAGALTRLFAILALVWMIAVWGFFGGAITRIAVVEVARQEKIGLGEALRFTLHRNRYLTYIISPLVPLALIGVLVLVMVLFGLIHLIPFVGDLVDALVWPVLILLGLGIALTLVGMIGWPLMTVTVSAEGTDAWEALSRSYQYILQAPWRFIWYSFVSLLYGAVVIFFLGLMGSLTVYLSKWGLSKTPGIETVNREPSYLFIYAPTSFDWRTLLLKDARTADGLAVVRGGEIDARVYKTYVESLNWWNKLAAFVVSIVWVGLVFLLVLGFGYSYFWSASSIIYLLIRKTVDDMEMDEVYLEEEDEGGYTGPLTTPMTPPAPSTSLPVVEAPRAPAAPAVPAPSAHLAPAPTPSPPPAVASPVVPPAPPSPPPAASPVTPPAPATETPPSSGDKPPSELR